METREDDELIIKTVDDVAPKQKPDLTDTEIQTGVPADHGNYVYYSFVYLGICILLPWSAVLNTFDFLNSRVSPQLSCTFFSNFR